MKKSLSVVHYQKKMHITTLNIFKINEVEWGGDSEVDVTVDLEENGLVEIEVKC